MGLCKRYHGRRIMAPTRLAVVDPRAVARREAANRLPPPPPPPEFCRPPDDAHAPRPLARQAAFAFD